MPTKASKKAVVFIQNTVQSQPFSQDYHAALYFKKLLCSHVTKLPFALNTDCEHLLFFCVSYFVVSIQHNLLCLLRHLFVLLTLQFYRTALLSSGENSTSVRLITYTGYLQVGSLQKQALRFQGFEGLQYIGKEAQGKAVGK